MEKLDGYWFHTRTDNLGETFNCGYCGNMSGPSNYYFLESGDNAYIYICPTCNRPTFINKDRGEQSPGPKIGSNLEHQPSEVENLYNEARNCLSVNSCTATVLCCRKLLMNIAVNKGAEEGNSFASYIRYLSDNHYIAPGSEGWIDHIRKKGNEANHELPDMSQEDAKELLVFTEMLLRFVYEMPGHMQKHLNQQSTQ